MIALLTFGLGFLLGSAFYLWERNAHKKSLRQWGKTIDLWKADTESGKEFAKAVIEYFDTVEPKISRPIREVSALERMVRDMNLPTLTPGQIKTLQDAKREEGP
jgi:hypothetical protein